MAIHRGSLDWFRQRMLDELEFNNHKNGWHHLSTKTLTDGIDKQWFPLLDAIKTNDTESIISRCANLANFAMMVADNAHRKQKSLTPAAPEKGE